MAAARMIESQREGAEVYHGEAICEEKLLELLDEFSVPRYLMQLTAVEELGFNRSTGFFWLRQKRRTERKIKNVGTLYADEEITGFVERRRVMRVTGIKGKELLIAVPVCDMLVGVPSSDKVKFTSAVGLSRVHPLSAFQPAKNSKTE